MKRLILPLLALSMLVACGKDNKSGKSEWNFADPYIGNYQSGNVPHFGGKSIDLVVRDIPCFAGAGGNTGRQVVQQPLTGYPSVIPPGDVYVGITSYGDVGVLHGQGNNNPVFIAYLCPRNFTSYQGATVGNIRQGTYTSCHFKPLVSATLVFPGNVGVAEFRPMDPGGKAIAWDGLGRPSQFAPVSVCQPSW